MAKNQPPVQETQETRVQALGQEDPLEEEMAAHSSILACEIPWTKKPGGPSPCGFKEADPRKTEHARPVMTEQRMKLVILSKAQKEHLIKLQTRPA